VGAFLLGKAHIQSRPQTGQKAIGGTTTRRTFGRLIAEGTIHEFLTRELDEFEWVKSLTPTQIDAALAELVPESLSQNLWLHQKASLLLMQHNPRFMFFIDMGGGKTNLMLTHLRHRKLDGDKSRAVVFVPYITAVDTWVQETAKFAPELECCPLIGSSIENMNALEGDHDLFVICYQSAVAMTTIRSTYKGQGKWLLDHKLVSQCFQGCDTLIMDEIQKCKSSQSLTFKMCRALSKQCHWVYGLTGTPYGRDLQDLWAQFYLIDFGETLSPTLGFYRLVFFSRKERFWGGFEFKFRKKMMPDLQRMIRNKSIRYQVSDFVGMPDKQYVQRHLSLPEGIKGYVERAKVELEQAVSTSKNYELAGNAFIQLRQLSSGFITFKNDLDQVKVKFEANPKLDALCELIEAMPSERKMVVFHEFVFTNELISDKLKELKVDHARVWGGQRDQIGQLTKFRTDPKCRVLVINSRSGSSSLNLQFANYIVFFEQPTSSIDRIQAEARCWRGGQQRTVFIYDLFVVGTYDQRIYQANKQGKDLLKQLLDKNQEI
jgi:SNF2 family DNA or RNA helicase